MPKQTFALTRLAGAAALLLATAPAAWAELQAPTLWQDWQDLYNRLGGTLGSQSAEYSNGKLVLEGLNYRTEMGGVVSRTDFGSVTMIEQPDGSVVIEVPTESVAQTSSIADGAQIDQSITTRHQNLSIVARDEGEGRVYDIAADTITIEVDSIVTEGDQAGEPYTVTMRMAGAESEYRSGLGADGDGFAQTSRFDGLDIASNYSDSGDEFNFTYVLTGVTSDFEGTFGGIPAGPVKGLSDMNITYDGTIGHSGSTLSMVGLAPGGPLDVSGTSQGGAMALNLGEESLGYSISSTGGKFSALVPGFPVPINISMAEVGSALTLPFGEPGVEKPFGLQISLRDLVLDDTLWGMFDPTGQLPRDPATLVLDMDGSAVMNIDVFGDPEAVAGMAESPGNLKTLTLNQLLLNIAGAELRGSGDLDFPTETPIPEPVGTIELALDGGFTLIDKIVALGFIPAQQAAFVKGMAGAITRPVGDDQLESTIEFTPGGGISANGMPLK
ncbi:hypothetical protein SAMN05444004_101137 [Jannaschia faecimaris]|uniref:DUF2125 domain-containing protein n=1 Tax=Jannaschia faecimaris TaxID=1244108 RepID=A0A1H3IYC1_9RHOB|nr:hypothetical protein [Jannaschia faecimaris]SDY32289.1 hypothetical protein SAMN05444004_101137 [Jannaschia faecimaris]